MNERNHGSGGEQNRRGVKVAFGPELADWSLMVGGRRKEVHGFDRLGGKIHLLGKYTLREKLML